MEPIATVETDPAGGVAEMLRGTSVATVSAILLRRGFRHQCLSGVRAIEPGGGVMAGPAYTLRFIPAREDIDTMAWLARPDNVQRRAVEECPPGAVLVIDAGSTRAASAGDLMARRLRVRGCAGMVTDGGFRDTAGIAAAGLPAYQRESAPCASPAALHPVDVGLPIGCAGVAIYPGDIVMGDADGVVAIPADIAAEVACEAVAAASYEDYAAERIDRGASLFDMFPASEASLEAFRLWQEANG
ncbi:dimethylmenaquinone methyltransferase [Sphingomonas histidinilytica]|uniref:RraA family protein n=1 Tax=Rhizorhabdus histidinilytica TaxID=439228 RepID=UPI000F7AFF51|nr:dimethylmenaquinone methyltransferase [Rhizorhabdus histidinilytica]MBO9376731.1 dimethylmenaquinone methyltransferase [Rhizorhabdus histidinilytica]QEH76824.1 dimethylmenaquinone methyltransferase [Sphingomonas sp. C8-2]